MCAVAASGCSSSLAPAAQSRAPDAAAPDSGDFLLAVSDAGSEHAAPPSTSPCDSTYLAIARLIFVGAGCTGGVCHTTPGPDVPAAGLNLTEADAYRALIDVPARSMLSHPWRRITPGDEQTSLLYLKLLAAEPFGGDALSAGVGVPMPIGLPPVQPEHLDALRAWIRAGAPERGIISGTEAFVAQCERAM